MELSKRVKILNILALFNKIPYSEEILIAQHIQYGPSFQKCTYYILKSLNNVINYPHKQSISNYFIIPYSNPKQSPKILKLQMSKPSTRTLPIIPLHSIPLP